MSCPDPLPAGYSRRSAGTSDVDAIAKLVGDCERVLLGRSESDRDTVAAVFARDGFEPATDTVLIHDSAGGLAGRAWVDRRSEADVHPDHRGRGLGEWLLAWIETRAAETGTAKIAQTVENTDPAARELLAAHGFAPEVTAWKLAIEFDGPPVVPVPPAGIEVRPFRPTDGPAAHALIEDAFGWQGRRRSYPEWAASTVERSAFCPEASVLAVTDNRAVGVLVAMDDPASPDGYVEALAVAADQRGRGIATVLLRRAFASFHRGGRRVCALWTHSDTGALSWYERIGMSVCRGTSVYMKELSGS